MRISVVLGTRLAVDYLVATGRNVLEALVDCGQTLTSIAGDKNSDPNKDDEKIQGNSLSN